MIVCKCIEKIRDKNGNIKKYRLQDTKGQCLDVEAGQLKLAMFSKQINVVNLKFSSDGKLIDKSDEEIAKDSILKSEKKIVDLINLRLSNSKESRSLTDTDNIKLMKLFKDTYNLPIERLRLLAEDKCDDLIFGCGTQKLVVTNRNFGILNYDGCLKIKGKYTSEFNTDPRPNGNMIMFENSKFHKGSISNISIEHVRNLVSILKENIAKVSYCELINTLTNMARSKCKQLRNVRYDIHIDNSDAMDQVYLIYEGTLADKGENIKTKDGKAVLVYLYALQLSYEYKYKDGKYIIELLNASEIFEDESDDYSIKYIDDSFKSKLIYIDANKPINIKELSKIFDESIKYNYANVKRMVLEELNK